MFCTKMTKLWVVVVMFAIPVLSQQTTENFGFGFPEMFNKSDCRNNSAVVLEKQENLYQEFVKCVTATVDTKQMSQDIRFLLRSIITAMKINSTLSELHTSSLRLYSQSYCPKLTTLMNCEEAYSSIYADCFTPTEVQVKKIKRDTVHSLVDYFCENNAEEFINFINGNFFECGIAKQFELRGCLKQFFSTAHILPDNVPLTTNMYCKSIDDFLSCSTTIFQQCMLSQSPGKLMQSLRLYVQKHGICSTSGSAMNLKMSLL